MNPKPAPVTPNALPLEQALRQSAPLTRLRDLLRDSNERFEAIRSCLPPTLMAHVRAGPIDDLGWSLLAANASVAAKLRQLQPRIEARLRERGWQDNAVKIKVQSG